MIFQTLKRASICTALCLGLASPIFAQGKSEEESLRPMPTLSEAFKTWSQVPFSFEALIDNKRRSRPDFQFKIDGVRYNVLFDAGRNKRNAILECLELADHCELRGTAFMVFENGKMELNVTDVNWLAVPAVDFDQVSSSLHRCYRHASRDRKKFSGIVEAKLVIEDLERRQGFSLDPIKPIEIGRGFEMLENAVTDCFIRRARLPLGEYHITIYTQSGEAVMDYFEE